MTEKQKKIIFEAAKILEQIKDEKGVSKVSIPVLFGLLSFERGE